jgi:hypothetical protein
MPRPTSRSLQSGNLSVRPSGFWRLPTWSRSSGPPGCDLDPENIAEEIFANHKEGLSDEPSEDGGFFFYFVRRELTEEVANYITATKRMMPRIL